jgi:hypothetical protein
MNNFDKYLKIAGWLANRYTFGGRLALSFGDVPSEYTKLERLAAEKYLNI